MEALEFIRNLDGELLLTILVVLFLCVKFVDIVMQWRTARNVEAKIYHKERIGSSVGTEMYLIYTDKGAFKNVDTIAFFKFNSSDIYGALQVGQTYNLRVCGRRARYRSGYPNIIGAKKTDGNLEYSKGFLNFV